MNASMPLPPQKDWFQSLTMFVFWLVMASMGALIVAALAWNFLGHPAPTYTRNSMYDPCGSWAGPGWAGPLAMYSTCTLILGFLYLLFAIPLTQMHYTVTTGENDSWTFWRLTEDNTLVTASPGMYWFDNKERLVALRPTMSLCSRFTVGSWINSFEYTVQFKGKEITREAAVTFYNWWQHLPSNPHDAEGMRTYLAQAERADNLPFTISVNRGPALAT